MAILKKFGLIGYPLGHSYSKGHFARKFEREGLACSYENFAIPAVELVKEVISENANLFGLNVTIPYKQTVMGFLDELDPIAREIGAVNAIKITRTGDRCILKGYNTDVIGFSRSFGRWPINKNMKALVLGSGGASLAIRYSLKQMGIRFLNIARKVSDDSITFEEITEKIAADYLIWINCTPVGMFPQISETLPLPYHLLTTEHFLYDLVYNPEITGFIKQGMNAGAAVMNGSAMLYEQAEASWEIWMRKTD
ncbi:MAG: shikimate dehydrogenase [Bacteroidales bacterium]|nr:shikimate dehydrogenase [Bacteroidales bacterium]